MAVDRKIAVCLFVQSVKFKKEEPCRMQIPCESGFLGIYAEVLLEDGYDL